MCPSACSTCTKRSTECSSFVEPALARQLAPPAAAATPRSRHVYPFPGREGISRRIKLDVLTVAAEAIIIAVMTANAAAKRPAPNRISARPGDPEFYRGDNYQIQESVGYLLRQVRLLMERAVDAEMEEH